MQAETQAAPATSLGAYAELVVNSDYSHRVRLTANRYTIGRSEDCDILMPESDPSVSRRHSALQRDAQGLWWLVDLASRNGTKVGPLRVAPDRPYQLRDGDRFQVGTNEIEFRLITTPLPIGAPPFAPAATPQQPIPNRDHAARNAVPEPSLVEPPTLPATPAVSREARTLPPTPIPTAALEPTILPGAAETASRREPTMMNFDVPPHAAAAGPSATASGGVPIVGTPVEPIIPATPVPMASGMVATPITPVTPVSPVAGAVATSPVAIPINTPPRDEDSVYDGPTVNSREIADAYRAGEIAPPPAQIPANAPPVAAPTPMAPSAASVAAPPLPVHDGNTVRMRVEMPSASPTQGRRIENAPLPPAPYPSSPAPQRPPTHSPYNTPSHATPPLTVGPGSSLLSREMSSRNVAGPSRAAARPPDALTALENGLTAIGIACGILMLLSFFLPWSQTKAGVGVNYLTLANRVGGAGEAFLALPALAALAPFLGAMLKRDARLMALILGGGAGLFLSTLLLFTKPGAAKALTFGGYGLFVYVLGCLAALGIGLWVRGASANRD